MPSNLIVALALLITSHLTLTHSQEIPDWGYTNRKSALNWQNIDYPNNTVCATGIIQSPIDLTSEIPWANDLVGANPLVSIPELKGAVLQNTGVLLEIAYPNSSTGFIGKTEYNGTTWEIDNFHFHVPSEHRVYEEFFPGEMHIVSHDVNNKNSKLVMAAILEISDVAIGMPFLEQIAEACPFIPTAPSSITLESAVDISPVTSVLSGPKTRNYAYIGSLTQPPCTEGVSWVVPSVTFPITVKQFLEIKKVLKFNSRYTQNILKDGNLLEIGCSGPH